MPYNNKLLNLLFSFINRLNRIIIFTTTTTHNNFIVRQHQHQRQQQYQLSLRKKLRKLAVSYKRHFVIMIQTVTKNAPDYRELAGGNTESRNWKGIVISLLVIFVVGTLIVVAVIVRRQGHMGPIETRPFSMDDIMDKRFDPRRFNGVWIGDDQFAYLSDQLDLMKFNCTNQSSSVLISNLNMRQFFGEKFRFFFSGNPNVVLFSYDMKQVFRHSILSRYKIYIAQGDVTYDVLPPMVYKVDQIQNALLSPNSRKLAFVYQNNIFLMQNYFNGDKSSQQITTDGQELNIYNGITDWLYEEEILYNTNALWWSPESTKLAYLKFDDSKVEYYVFPTYDGTPYSNLNKIRYPKPQGSNPIVKLFIFQTRTNRTLEVDLPDVVKNRFVEYYIWNVKWLDDSAILCIYVNRRQNEAVITKYDTNTGQILFKELYPPTTTDSWFLPSGLITSPTHAKFYQIWPYHGYKNIISFDAKTGKPRTLTDHRFDVTDLVALNEKNGYLYYLATHGDPKQKHLFKKNVLNVNEHPKCLTCNASMTYSHENPSENLKELSASKHCLYNVASFSPNGDYYVLECLGDMIPIVKLKSDYKPDLDYVLESNDELRSFLSGVMLPKKAYLRIPLDKDNNHSFADAELLYPNNFNPKDAYPVLVHVYNGPTSQTVDFQFRIRKFESFLCINFGVIVVTMDGRGTDSNGDRFMKSIGKHLGLLETTDQLTLVKFSVWGWSYGGFLSAMLLFQNESPFKCAVSGAPVTDWTFYDTAYTERFLGLYPENREAYERSNLTQLAKLNHHYFARKKMLLIHGTGDDNVHFQNSAILAKVLRATKLEFEFEVYPDIPHTPDEDTQLNLYQKISKFLIDCYGLNVMAFYEQLKYSHMLEEYQEQKSGDEEKE